jgi:hypothetical protein
VTAITDAGNDPAQLFRQLGVRREGYFLEHVWFKGGGVVTSSSPCCGGSGKRVAPSHRANSEEDGPGIVLSRKSEKIATAMTSPPTMCVDAAESKGIMPRPVPPHAEADAESATFLLAREKCVDDVRAEARAAVLDDDCACDIVRHRGRRLVICLGRDCSGG